MSDDLQNIFSMCKYEEYLSVSHQTTSLVLIVSYSSFQIMLLGVSSCPHVQVSFRKTLNPKLLLMCKCLWTKASANRVQPK